ncbi:YncE family protein [Streptomyces sp. NPDC004596]
MRIRTLPAAAALAAMIGSMALAAPSYADTDRSIPVWNVDDTVVDGLHQQIFLSDGYKNQIVVTDYSGRVVGTVTGLGRVAGLQLSPDGGTLYAAVYEAGKIVAIDTGTLQQTAEYPTGDRTAPVTLAYADGKLWFGYGDQWESGLGVVDLTAGTPTVTLDLAGAHDFSSPPALYADPHNPGTLLALDGNISSAPIVVYDVSSGTPRITASAEKGGSYADAELTPDGQDVVVAGPGPRVLTEYRLSDLSQVRTYPLPENPETVSIAPDGTVAATIPDTEDKGDTYVFTGGADGTPSVRNLSHAWMPGGGHSMSWSPDGGKLFVQTGSDTSTRLYRVDEPRKYAPVMTVNAPSTATRTKPLTVTGKLTAGVALPAGTPLKVTRTDLDSPDGKSLGTKTLGTGGTFSFTDAPPAGSKVTYTVTYAGDATHTSAAASDTVEVSRAKPGLSIDNDGKVYAYGKDVRFTAHLGSTYKNRTVEIWADPYGPDKPNKLVRSGTVDSHGNLSAVVDMKRDTKVTVKFAGDSHYQPRSASSTAGAEVKVSTSVSGHYKTEYTYGHTYYYFHKSKDPRFTTDMTYYRGRRQRLELEVYANGKWQSAGAQYFALGSDGVSRVQLTGTHDTGRRMRARSSYYNFSSGDNVNSTTHGAWKYFVFTS